MQTASLPKLWRMTAWIPGEPVEIVTILGRLKWQNPDLRPGRSATVGQSLSKGPALFWRWMSSRSRLWRLRISSHFIKCSGWILCSPEAWNKKVGNHLLRYLKMGLLSLQINVHHKAATHVLSGQPTMEQINISLTREPLAFKDRLRGL